MSASEFLQHLTQVCFLLIALVVVRAAVRQPTPARIDIAVFFGVTTLLIGVGWLFALLDFSPPPLVSALNSAFLMALPYLLIRLVNDFTTVPKPILHGAEAGLALAIVGLVVFTPPYPTPFVLLLVCYFFACSSYVAVAFVRAARTSGGVTRRRMQAVAVGSGLLGLGIFVLGIVALLPEPLRDAIMVFQRLAVLASGVGYFIGFAPPALLRRAWQEPELRSFLGRAASLPRLPDTAAIVRELERGAMAAVGAPAASIGLWDEATDTLTYSGPHGPVAFPSDQLIGGRAFTSQLAVFSPDAPRDDPQHAALYRATAAMAILAAPITAGQRRLGVLSVFAPRAPIFAEEDLRLVQLLADQGAVILESRALIDEASRVRAREEATRLKDDFLSAAAHDLKTPLTTIIANAQLLERRAVQQPDQPPNVEVIRRIVAEGVRLRTIVLDLLDASRTEQGKLLGRREPVDLVALAREIGDRHSSDRHPVAIEAPGAAIGAYDRARIAQLLENLVENAIKYSPAGGEVRIAVRPRADSVEVTVADRGIGIPEDDLPHLFARFHRGANVNDRQFAGMGLGLYICKGIVAEHGGQIRVSSVLGQGTTFHVTLPRRAEDAPVGIQEGAVEGARTDDK